MATKLIAWSAIVHALKDNLRYQATIFSTESGAFFAVQGAARLSYSSSDKVRVEPIPFNRFGDWREIP